jgi:hypothetical protein
MTTFIVCMRRGSIYENVAINVTRWHHGVTNARLIELAQTVSRIEYEGTPEIFIVTRTLKIKSAELQGEA